MSENHLLGNYNRYPVEFAFGEGAYLYDHQGSKYTDFLSGIAVTGFGHAQPDITSAVMKQLNGVWHTSNLFDSSGQKTLAATLAEKSGLDKVFFCNSGTEANEAAIKFARKWGNGRYHIITALGGFHGRTMGALSATGQPKLWNGFFPLVYGFTSVPFGVIESIKSAITPQTVAIMLEPILGEGGVIVPQNGYLKAVKELCEEHNLLLILDEVQTGMGRTGKWFAHQHDDIKPDIITLAKGIANGLPLGALICSDDVASVIKPGDHGSTFGGNPVSVAAANAVTELLTDEVLAENLELGDYFVSQLTDLSLPEVLDIRGKGLMIGIQLADGISSKTVAGKLLNQGIVVGTSGDSVIRVLPPFVISKADIDHFIFTFSAVLAGAEAQGVAV